MSTSFGRSHARHITRLRQVGIAAALLAGVGLAACTSAEPSISASTADAVTVPSLPQSGELDPGTYLVTGFTVPFEITVPDGWESGGWFVFRSDSEEAGVAVNFQVAGFVPTDACAWQGAIVEVDQSPEAFAAAMAAQTSTSTTPVTEIMLGGFSGLEFDHAVESDVDILKCDERKICLHSDAAINCARWHSSVDERETYRVVDLNGEPAVIAVLNSGPVDPAVREQARAVFDSIAFAPEE